MPRRKMVRREKRWKPKPIYVLTKKDMDEICKDQREMLLTIQAKRPGIIFPGPYLRDRA